MLFTKLWAIMNTNATTDTVRHSRVLVASGCNRCSVTKYLNVKLRYLHRILYDLQKVLAKFRQQSDTKTMYSTMSVLTARDVVIYSFTRQDTRHTKTIPSVLFSTYLKIHPCMYVSFYVSIRPSIK